MLREGLRAEIPALFDLAARIRPPMVPAMTPIFAAVGAVGIESLTVALVRTVQSAGLFATGTFVLRNTEPVIVLGYALALAFAFGSARWRGVLSAVAVFAVIFIEQFVLNLPGRLTFCDRSGSPCDWAAIYWPVVWPELLGIAVGIVAGRVVRRGDLGRAALAIGIAIFVLSFSVGRLAFVPLLGLAPVGEDAREAVNILIGVQVLGAIAAGFVVGSFGKRHLIDAVVLVVYFIGPWSPQLRTPDLFYLGFHIERDWQFLVPVGYALAAMAGLAIGAARSRYFATSTPTIP